jgi:hypothetical protein
LIYILENPSLQFVFENYKFNKTVKVVSYGYRGFGMSSSNPIRYFVTNVSKGRIFVFDEEWNYISENSSFTEVWHMISVGNNFYITGSSNLWKTDEQLNILIQYNSVSYATYRGLYYSSSNNLIYMASWGLRVIHVFSLNLELIDTILTAPYIPCEVNGYNNQLYVATTNGTMLVIVNKKIINQFNRCNGQWDTWLTSILFDQFNNMATACYNYNQLYLYNSSGSYLYKNIPTAPYPYYIGFDYRSRLVVVTDYQATIYYYDF